MTLRMKVILAFGLITIPLVSFLLYTNYYSSQVVREQVESYNSALLTLYGDQIDQMLETNNSYLYKLANQEPRIRSLMYNINKGDEYVLTRVAVSEKLYSDFPYNKNVYLDFVYIPPNQDLITAQPTQSSYEEYVSIHDFLRGLFNDAANREKLMEFKFLWTSCQIKGEKFLLSIVSTDTNTYVGALIKINDLMTPLQLIARDRKISAYFLNTQGQWLAPTLPDAADEVTKAVREAGSVNQGVRGKDTYLLVQHRMRLSDLVLAVMIPEKVMLQQVPLFQRITYAIPFAAGILLLIFLMYLQKLVIKPMQRLIQVMRQISKGNLDIRLTTDHSYEFSLIDATFNNMASQIHDLKIHVYEEEIRSQKAELKQLQLQMNPHFLFNSLNIIYSLAETGKVQLIQQMTRHMVGYLRFFARLKDHLITVGEEMENIEHYMQIQMLRFPKHLDYKWTIDESIGEVLIPPLTIQPFVENAIKHGFRMGKDIFRIRVSVSSQTKDEKGYYEIRIEDNGKGFPAELIENLTERMEDRSFTDEHIGIWNVFHQLKMLYHGEAELKIANLEPHGACVSIRIPLRLIGQKEGETRHVQPIDRG
ncbi:sensor histidine kinase YesM [Paenibacillus marchantiophytorum]|uniref:Sensor histidine kinase YesM n=1 Tax=Paenibacillus marchantiophytorum TaxID=1619310 RepID=A0ABQ1EZK5_9BACL|nr:histidine kinase [Paenibacillus marchantiophytorum]GFZ94813.1 sensor histidine kinase YesM [Paenibacillus marchantiophytorum]